ncbi:Ribosomal protein L7Ae [Geosporobacter subterraneus DSM 17957]|uniref:Ribosomal protein L7Ae n=1 Tax=Geosporobacter subterraneus DSM 17957 TaxID=1121919 RepID=A0A1M6E0L2_9FIRM|nr:ribosomal L7Ae/L30e/S12e/Gadd45 family protein [Geosporobacter subterraneus]SHI78991.1 Ribosomal protein L7Ae [Geosporobacter subterraneus DSM 17957]
MPSKFFSLLGLAQRSGNLVTGEDTCEAYIKKGNIKLLIVAEDASANTKKKFHDLCSYRNIKMITYGDRDQMSHAIGKSNRAVYGIKDVAFSQTLLKLINEEGHGVKNSGGE